MEIDESKTEQARHEFEDAYLTDLKKKINFLENLDGLYIDEFKYQCGEPLTLICIYIESCGQSYFNSIDEEKKGSYAHIAYNEIRSAGCHFKRAIPQSFSKMTIFGTESLTQTLDFQFLLGELRAIFEATKAHLYMN